MTAKAWTRWKWSCVAASRSSTPAKAGDKTEIKYKLAVSYYRLSINGQVLIEIHPVNFVEVVNGIDRLAQVRAALGI